MNVILEQIKHLIDDQHGFIEPKKENFDEIIEYFKVKIKKDFFDLDYFDSEKISDIKILDDELKLENAESIIFELMMDTELDNLYKKSHKVSTAIFSPSINNKEGFYIKLTQIRDELFLIYITEGGDNYLIIDENNAIKISNKDVNKLDSIYFGVNGKSNLLNDNIKQRSGHSITENTKVVKIEYSSFSAYVDDLPDYLVLAPCIYNQKFFGRKAEYVNRYSFVFYLMNNNTIVFTSPGNMKFYDNFCLTPPDQC